MQLVPEPHMVVAGFPVDKGAPVVSPEKSAPMIAAEIERKTTRSTEEEEEE
jgi:hypothetical protein